MSVDAYPALYPPSIAALPAKPGTFATFQEKLDALENEESLEQDKAGGIRQFGYDHLIPLGRQHTQLDQEEEDEGDLEPSRMLEVDGLNEITEEQDLEDLDASIEDRDTEEETEAEEDQE